MKGWIKQVGPESNTVRVEFDVYEPEEVEIVIRAQREMAALWTADAKKSLAPIQPSAAPGTITFTEIKASGTTLAPEYDLTPQVAPPVAPQGAPQVAQPVDDFINLFRAEAQRITAPVALNILREQFGVNRATELAPEQQVALLASMAAV